MLTYAPAAMHISLRKTFYDFKADKPKIFAGGMAHLDQNMTNADPELVAACINSLLIGIFLGSISEDGQHKKALLGSYIDNIKLAKGENVISFVKHKAEKGKR